MFSAAPGTREAPKVSVADVITSSGTDMSAMQGEWMYSVTRRQLHGLGADVRGR